MKPTVETLNTLTYWDPMGTRDIIVLHPWGIRVNSVLYRVPRGLRSDGASIPRLLWRVIDPPLYTLLRPGVILHDAAYHGLLRATGPMGDWLPVERDEADQLLAIVGHWNGAARVKCTAVEAGVRLFGQPAWDHGHAKYSDIDPTTLDYHLTHVVTFDVSLN